MPLLKNDPSDRCGYSWLSLRADHPFAYVCKKHDVVFEARDRNIFIMGRNGADKGLLADMLAIARDRASFALKLQAYACYGLARLFGKLVW